jgi:hypothetical protein
MYIATRKAIVMHVTALNMASRDGRKCILRYLNSDMGAAANAKPMVAVVEHQKL